MLQLQTSLPGADWGVSTTGIAGPGGGTVDKPVGTVCVGLSAPDGRVQSTTIRLGGDRSLVRKWSVSCALDALRSVADAQRILFPVVEPGRTSS